MFRATQQECSGAYAPSTRLFPRQTTANNDIRCLEENRDPSENRGTLCRDIRYILLPVLQVARQTFNLTSNLFPGHPPLASLTPDHDMQACSMSCWCAAMRVAVRLLVAKAQCNATTTHSFRHGYFMRTNELGTVKQHCLRSFNSMRGEAIHSRKVELCSARKCTYA